MPYFSRMSVTFFKIASNGLDICILKDLGLNWRVTKILSQIWFRGSVLTAELSPAPAHIFIAALVPPNPTQHSRILIFC